MDCCPYCSSPLSSEFVILWDGRAYCRKCVEAESPQLCKFAKSGVRLEETIDRRDVRAFHYVSYFGKRYLGAVMLIFGLPGGLLFLGGKIEFEAVLFVLAFFDGCGMALVTLQAILGAVLLRSRLPRTVFVEHGRLTIVDRKSEMSIRLSECRWGVGPAMVDQLCIFTGLRRGVLIYTPNFYVACGRSPETFEHWRAFLTLTQIPRLPEGGCVRFLAFTFGGMIGVALVGAGIGELIAQITQKSSWTLILGLLGGIDGACAGIIYAACTTKGNEAARKLLHASHVGLGFLMIGMTIGVIGGLQAALAFGVFNAFIGCMFVWCCRAKIHAAEMKREVTEQLRR